MAEDDAQTYVLAFENNKSEALRVASRTAQRLQNGDFKLVDIIKAAGEYLQNTDPKIRERATNYLSAIIAALPPKALTRYDIPVLNAFLCSRMQDGGAIEGLSKLQSLGRYSKENAQELVQAIFDNFSDMSDRKQSERYQIYMLLNELLGNHRQAMLDMGDKSLLGYVRVVGGEKDPRNLMLIFSMLRVFMIEWDISKHVDAMFDSVYAYFPITFRPPPNDPYGITAQDLKDRLKDCLASNGELAPSTFPNLLDRLDSTSEIVKKDVLQALAACALNYDPPTITQFSISLWDAVKFEVLQAQEPFLADEALNVIKNIAICLSRKTTSHAPEWKADPLIQYLKPINKECLDHLQEPASRQAGASGDILKAAASATTRSFEIVIQAVGPALFTLLRSLEGINNQRALLSVANKIFEASIEVYGSWAVPSAKNENGQETPIAEFKDRLLAIYSRALMSTVQEEVSYRLASVKGLLLLAEQRQMLDENEIGLIVQHFNEIVLDEESYGRDELKRRAMEALAQISNFKPRLITDITFPKFIARLPDDEAQASESQGYQSVLEGLAQISVGRDLLETLVRRLLNKLDLLIQVGGRTEYPYTCSILSTVYFVLDRSAKDPQLRLESYFDRIVVGLSKKAAMAFDGPLASETVLSLLGRVTNLVIRRSSDEYKDHAARNVYDLFREINSSDANHTRLVLPSNALTLSTWVLAALQKSSTAGVLGEPLIPLIKILRKLADRNTSTKYTPAIEQACLRQIAILINKHVSKQEDIAEVDAFFHSAVDCVSGSNAYQLEEEAQHDWQCAVRYLFTISKACLLRLMRHTDQLLILLVNLLEKLPPGKARYLALGFGTLLAQDEILSKTNEAQIRLLAPQRVFQKIVPMFSEHFRDPKATQEQKETYLIALSGILGSVNSEIVMPELPTLLPLLLQSLEISDVHQNVKVATLETMIIVITKNPDALVESGHIPALTRRLIVAAALPKASRRPAKNTSSLEIPKSADTTMTDAPSQSISASSPKTRQLALHCLALLPQRIKYQKTPNPLLPLKREVLNGLANCLDDPKRDVRKEAVGARARWLRNVDDADDSDED